jgi:hypothetical protein
MGKWGVLVVHGVGDTGEGVTVGTFLWSLVNSGAGLIPDGVRRVRWFPQPAAGGSSTAPTPPSVGSQPSLFPVHLRYAKLTAPAGAVTEAVFAEVYWADLSRVREGTLPLLYGIVSSIFFLRFIPDWAAYLDGSLARWVRYLLHLGSWFLCGPIAALNALAYMLAGYFWVLSPLAPPAGSVPGAVGMAADPHLGTERIGMAC